MSATALKLMARLQLALFKILQCDILHNKYFNTQHKQMPIEDGQLKRVGPPTWLGGAKLRAHLLLGTIRLLDDNDVQNRIRGIDQLEAVHARVARRGPVSFDTLEPSMGIFTNCALRELRAQNVPCCCHLWRHKVSCLFGRCPHHVEIVDFPDYEPTLEDFTNIEDMYLHFLQDFGDRRTLSEALIDIFRIMLPEGAVPNRFPVFPPLEFESNDIFEP
jgi:hypothetical protein